jgi:polyamine oxidase
MQKLLIFSLITTSLLVRCVLTKSCSLDPKGEATKVDVLVLGAGIAGIAAARTLEVNGIDDFMVLEATDRIGGRIREDNSTKLEVGASWIQGIDLNDPERHPIWREWLDCDEDGPDGSPTPDITFMYDQSGNPINISQYQNTAAKFEETSEVAEKIGMSLDPSEDISLSQALSMAGWLPNTTLDNFTEWYYVDFCIAIRPEELSVKVFYNTTAYTDFLGPEPDAEAEDYYITDRRGYSFVVDCMARNFKDHVKLNTLITAIQTADDCVCVTTEESERYCGDYGIVTFSIGALQAAINEEEDSVRFEPPLPEEKQQAINSVTLVHYGRIHLIRQHILE